MAQGNGFVMENGEPEEEGVRDAMPKIDFSSFILSLYSSGLVQLGKVEDPSSGKKGVNLDMAHHTIDMIAMLQDKTKGNLSEEEESLLKALLSEIRMAYVEAAG
ncbi:MAG: DUF1844 domain-containing protein [Desulfobacter sp.]|nr:DUF1844 domain-containing protein [Desulfobacter sp.]WDP85465.1 MAG: DUF1844 domain-containing protein [Desulfobacter sp.]